MKTYKPELIDYCPTLRIYMNGKRTSAYIVLSEENKNNYSVNLVLAAFELEKAEDEKPF